MFCSTNIYLCPQGPGTDEASLIEIFMTRTNPQIQELRNVYGDGKNFKI